MKVLMLIEDSFHPVFVSEHGTRWETGEFISWLATPHTDKIEVRSLHFDWPSFYQDDDAYVFRIVFDEIMDGTDFVTYKFMYLWDYSSEGCALN